MPNLPSGTVTLLFSDIEDSTGLTGRLGDEWPAVLERTRTILAAAVAGAGGVVVDRQGDSLFAAFDSARAAIAAASAMQRALAAESWPDGETLQVRMALHTGEPDRREDAYMGLDVALAARLCAAGHGGQVLLSESTQIVARPPSRSLGIHQLKGFDQPQHVHQLEGDGLPTEFPPLRAAEGDVDQWTPDPASAEQRLKHAEQQLEARINDHVARQLERTFGRRKPR